MTISNSKDYYDGMKTGLELAQEHWNWLKEVLDKQREMERRLFIDAFVHGFGHGVEWQAKKQQDSNVRGVALED